MNIEQELQIRREIADLDSDIERLQQRRAVKIAELESAARPAEDDPDV